MMNDGVFLLNYDVVLTRYHRTNHSTLDQVTAFRKTFSLKLFSQWVCLFMDGRGRMVVRRTGIGR